MDKNHNMSHIIGEYYYLKMKITKEVFVKVDPP